MSLASVGVGAGSHSPRLPCSLAGLITRATYFGCTVAQGTVNRIVNLVDFVCAPVYSSPAARTASRQIRRVIKIGSFLSRITYLLNKPKMTPSELQMLSQLEDIYSKIARQQALSAQESRFLAKAIEKAIFHPSDGLRFAETEDGVENTRKDVFLFLKELSISGVQLLSQTNLNDFNTKLRNIRDFLRDHDGVLKKDDKLTLSEFGSVNGFARMPCVELIVFAKQTELIEDLSTTIRLSKRVMALSEICPEKIPDGSILIRDIPRMGLFDSREKCNFFLRRYGFGHTAVKCTRNGRPGLFHLMNVNGAIGHVMVPSSKFLLTSRVLKINFASLVTPWGVNCLRKNLGPNAKIISSIQRMYSEILQEVLQEDYSHIAVSPLYYSFFFKTRATPGMVSLVNTDQESMICSELIARITVICMSKLDLKIKELCHSSHSNKVAIKPLVDPYFRLSTFSPRDFFKLTCLHETQEHLGKLPKIVQGL